MEIFAAALLIGAAVAGAVAWGVSRITAALARRQGGGDRSLQLLTAFAPALTAVEHDPRALLAWQPLAAAARQLFPEEFASLDRAAGAMFPFSPEQMQAAHARWTTEWLEWERSHDAEYKLKAALIEEEIGGAPASTAARARLDAIETEKLERYQKRYAEYTRVSKALQNLIKGSAAR